jgi:hypothetical protein
MTNWDEVKLTVQGVRDCDVGPATITEALVLSRSPEHFIQLLRAAFAAADGVNKITWGSEE